MRHRTVWSHTVSHSGYRQHHHTSQTEQPKSTFDTMRTQRTWHLQSQVWTPCIRALKHSLDTMPYSVWVLKNVQMFFFLYKLNGTFFFFSIWHPSDTYCFYMHNWWVATLCLSCWYLSKVQCQIVFSTAFSRRREQVGWYDVNWLSLMFLPCIQFSFIKWQRQSFCNITIDWAWCLPVLS